MGQLRATSETGAAGGEPVRHGRLVKVPPPHLAADLARLIADGYTAAELSVEALQCILGGRLLEPNLARVTEVCASFGSQLAYSVHAPAVLDLRHQQYPDLHREILLSCVRFASAIRARVLVVHYEARSDDPAVEGQYRAAIEHAADLAGRYGLILGIENIEIERTERVLEFLEALRHPAARMTYDFAHDYLASDHFGYDHLDSARACAPYAAHLHLTDNFGRFNQARLGDFGLYRAIPAADINITGLGDLHLPLGWGTLAAGQIYAPFAARSYQGLLITEHRRDAFSDYDAEVRRAMEAVTGSVRG